MGQIKVKGTMQRVAMFDEDRVIGHAVQYSTIREDEIVDYASKTAHIPESNLLACTLALREPAPELKARIASTTINTLVEEK